jgi:hypothetical protein
VNTPDYGGVIIRLYSVNYTLSDPIIRIDTFSPSGRVFLTFQLTHDLSGWHATLIGGIAE